MKPIEYLGTIFFDLMRIQPRETFVSSSLYLASSIIKLDMKIKERENNWKEVEENKKWLKKLEHIQKNTNDELLVPLAKIEAIVASKEKDQWGKEYDGKNVKGERVKVQDQYIDYLDLYLFLKEAYGDIVNAVVDVVQDYSSDFRYMGNNNEGGWLSDPPQMP